MPTVPNIAQTAIESANTFCRIEKSAKSVANASVCQRMPHGGKVHVQKVVANSTPFKIELNHTIYVLGRPEWS